MGEGKVMKHDIVTFENKKSSTVDLSATVFDVPVNMHVVNQVVHWQRARAQAGTHQTKGISDISGTTRKPHAQKGTGKARQGSLRTPQHRGGATIHGPQVRSHGYALPKKIRKLALRIVLSEKLRSGDLIILDTLAIKKASTKDILSMASTMKMSNALFVGVEAPDNTFARGLRNLKDYQYIPSIGLNVYDALRYDKLALSQEALVAIQERLA